jgi:hypothetical protein
MWEDRAREAKVEEVENGDMCSILKSQDYKAQSKGTRM